MADDGMLLNFELGDAPIKSQVKFTGGRWRDRVRAQKGVKKFQAKQLPDAETEVRDKDDDDRPTKRQRIEDGAGAGGRGEHGRRSGQRPNAGPWRENQLKPGHVTSSLFSSNPTPKSVFEDQPAEETEPAKPSNAPLSDEAENFLALGLSRRVAQHLSAKLEMKAPTAIQKHTIPQLIKEDNDAFLQAETGSGKTLAYLLPIVHRIMALSQATDGTSTGTQIHRDSGLFAIVLAPTRELCKQIAAVLEKLLRCAPWIVSTTVIGGESKKSEKARLRKGVNILIATPGRLTDHLDHTKVLDVGTVRWLVLDEGDRMMEMGFEDDLKLIVSKIRKDDLLKENKDGVVLDAVLPARRVTILCSATMKMDVQKLGEISLQDAVHITASRSDAEHDKESGISDAVFSAPSQLKQSYLVVPAKLRLVTLIALLRSTFARRGSVMKAIIFISCSDSVNFHFDLLKSTAAAEPPSPVSPPATLKETSSMETTTETTTETKPEKTPTPKDTSSSTTEKTVAPAAYITSPANPAITLHKLHGSLAQPVRTSTLHSFATTKNPAVLITTDISSRGLDVPAVELVIEYDPAFAADDHVHRVGRTARAGRPGKAVLFLQPGCEEGYIKLLNPSSPIVPQLYDTVLQKGLSSAIDLPTTPSSSTPSTSTAPENPLTESQKVSYTARAEALQLHIEQRLLVKPTDTTTPTPRSARGRHPPPPPRDDPLLDAARRAFRSHVRAYATHVREERGVFDMAQLHLGHMAKAFGLREAPGGIGGGASRRTYRPTTATTAAAGRKRAAGGGADDDERGDAGGNQPDGDAARRMREKMKAVMSASSEFNIG